MTRFVPGLAVIFSALWLSAPAASALEAKFVYGCERRKSWCSDLTCTFDGSPSTTTAGTITGYRWYFRRYLAEDRESEYATKTGKRVTHTYTNVRCRSYTYYATLEVYDSLGNKVAHTERVDASRTMDLTENKKPTADFTAACKNLECFFDGSASTDADGTIASYNWTFGDGNTGAGQTVYHTYSAGGSYNARLTVADDRGATDSVTKTVSVIPAGISLTANGRTVQGLQKGYLVWTGAEGADVDVYRNGAFITTTPNDGRHTDDINLRGKATYKYRVCQRASTICSNEATIVFDDN
jgi:PKD repeat protein